MKRLPQHLRIDDADYHLQAMRKGANEFELRIGEQRVTVKAGPLGGHGFWFEDATGHRHTAYAAVLGEDLQLRVDGRTWLLPTAERTQGQSEQIADPTRVVAPMTGTILKLLVQVGDRVQKDEELLVLSAMKMEHRLTAACDGEVAEVHTEEEMTVDAGTLLIRLK